MWTKRIKEEVVSKLNEKAYYKKIKKKICGPKEIK